MAVTANAMKGDRDKCIQVPLPSEEGTNKNVFQKHTSKPRPDSTVLFLPNSFDILSNALKDDRDKCIPASSCTVESKSTTESVIIYAVTSLGLMPETAYPPLS